MIAIKINGIYNHLVNVIFFFRFRLLLNIVDYSASCTPANLLEVVNLVALHAFLTTSWALSGLMAASTVFPILLHIHFNRCM